MDAYHLGNIKKTSNVISKRIHCRVGVAHVVWRKCTVGALRQIDRSALMHSTCCASSEALFTPSSMRCRNSSARTAHR